MVTVTSRREPPRRSLFGYLIKRRSFVPFCLLVVAMFWILNLTVDLTDHNTLLLTSRAVLPAEPLRDSSSLSRSELTRETIKLSRNRSKEPSTELTTATNESKKSEECVPPELARLTTNYTARLCHEAKWAGNSSAEIAELACQFPSLNPFDRVVGQLLKNVQRLDCGRPKMYPRLFTTDLDYLVTLQDPSAHGYESCCYQSVASKSVADMHSTTFKSCRPIISKRQKLLRRYEFIKVYCWPAHDKNSSIPTYTEYLAFIRLRPEVEKNARRRSSNDSISIAILGIDSMSHMNFIRTMPRSYEYLNQELEAFGLFGFNKVGDNTFGNMIPLLTGMSAEQITSRPRNGCPIWKGPYDNCPFIWKTFASHGYYTVYGEDWTHLTMFNYMKRGFLQPPTHYYLRPLIKHSDAYFKKLEQQQNEFSCHAGPKLHFQYLLDYMKSVAKVMARSRRPYFEYLWENSLTHHHLTLAKSGDEPLLETLKWFREGGYLNQTVLILMSDHGMRYLGFRDTLQGRYEDRMPFLFIVVPPWFARKFPRAAENLRENKRRLTSVYDLHHTLQDLLYLKRIQDSNILVRQGQMMAADSQNRKLRHRQRRYGHSLFLPIPKARLCPEAGIPPLFCICHQFEPATTDDFEVRKAARFVVQEINLRLGPYPKCAHLALEKILSAHKVIIPSRQLKFSKDVVAPKHLHGQSAKDYIRQLIQTSSVVTIVFETKPGQARFEGTVSRTAEGKLTLWGGINRINLYGNQSHCVWRYEIKPFCFCHK